MMDIHGDKFNSHLFQHKLKMLFAKNPQSFVPNPALSYQYFGKAAVSIQTEEDGRSYADNWPCCLTGWEHWEVSWTKVVNVGQDTNRFAFLSPTSGEVRHAAVKLLRAAFRDVASTGRQLGKTLPIPCRCSAQGLYCRTKVPTWALSSFCSQWRRTCYLKAVLSPAELLFSLAMGWSWRQPDSWLRHLGLILLSPAVGLGLESQFSFRKQDSYRHKGGLNSVLGCCRFCI